MAKRVDGKVAFVTGAARGQGRSHAVRLAEEGANIIAVDVCGGIDIVTYPSATEEDLAETVRQVESLGQKIVASKVDVRDYESLAEAVRNGVEAFGRLDIVSANAGIGPAKFLTHEVPELDWQTMLDVNLTGVWHTCKAAIPFMIEAGNGGSIVLTSSILGLHGSANVVHYVAAKHGVVGLMRSLAQELAPHMIRVNTINPGNANTHMLHNDSVRRMFVPQSEDPTLEEFAAATTAMSLMPVPWVEPIDISNALLFLASQEARFITGVTLPVDAGFLVK